MKTKHSITERKVNALMKSSLGMEMTGYILTEPDSDKIAFVHMGRTRWYDHDEAMVILGHMEKQDDQKD